MSFQMLNLCKIISRLLYVQDVIILETVNSTNQYLIDNILYLKSGTVCLAEYQTDGRGRYGKHWISPISNNIYLSIYWNFLKQVKNKRELINILGLVISVVVREVLEQVGVRGLTLKWPNDIYCKGRKLVGILVEIVTQFCGNLHVVIGIGINTTSIFNDPMDRIHIISLEEVGIFVDRNMLAASIINALYHSLVYFDTFGFIPFFYRWLLLDNFCNKPAKLLIGNRIITGIVRGISYNGFLLMEHSGLIYSYSCTSKVSLSCFDYY